MTLREHRYFIKLYRTYRKIYNTFLNLYFFFYRRRNSKITKTNLKKNIFAVEIYNKMGIGANLVWALEIMAYCNENGLTPRIKFTHPNSKQKKEDYFNYYFKIRDQLISNKKIRFAKMRGFNDLNLNFQWNYNEKLTLALADKLIKKYLVVKTNIIEEVEEFCFKHFNTNTVLGVHFRGTDKKSEAKRLSYETIEKNINLYVTKYPKTNRVFISSDDENFITYNELPRPKGTRYQNNFNCEV